MATYSGLDGSTGTALTVVAGGLTITAGVFRVSSSGFEETDLQINSVNRLDFQIGALGSGVDILGLDDAAITGLAGAADTVGQDLFMQTQDGGVSGAGNVGRVGGAWTIQTGDGSIAGSTSNCIGGAGGAFDIVTGAGAAGDAATAAAGGAGGAGGAATVTSVLLVVLLLVVHVLTVVLVEQVERLLL